jgi:hypothetical protein
MVEDASAHQQLAMGKGAGMKNKTHFWRNTICGTVALAIVGAAPALAKHICKNEERDAAMTLHHMHTMLDHGLIMVLQGADLRMLSTLNTAPGIDQATAAHGSKMISEGKATIREMLSGSHMRRMHEQGRWSDPQMSYTHELGAAMLAVVDDVDHLAPSDTAFPDRIRMCHIRIALNHALEMAAEGANLAMLGKMAMAGGIDAYSVTHGHKMIIDARKLWDEIIGGHAMKEIHSSRTSPEISAQMPQIQRMAKDGDKLLVLLEKMDTAK